MKRLLILFLILVSGGCSGPHPDGMPKLYHAAITITQENEPLEGAIVQLISEEPSLASWGPSGVTNAQGIATLQTNGRFPGAPVGNFKVIVTKREIEKHPHPEWAGLPDGDPNYQKFLEMGAKLKSYSFVEPQYGDIVKTPLNITIKAEKNNFTLDVGKKTNDEVQGMK